MTNYKRYLESYYNMGSKITLADYLGCLQLMSVVDIYAIDDETNEEYFGTLGRGDISELSDKEKAYKVIRIMKEEIIIYIG